MNKSALIMMVLSMILLWGGLLAAVVHLARHPDEAE
ncbi:MAG: methionine/alanine import family NSS transporter small subunit [Moraxellaceae bacterium]|nr:MAG: methionine/alanine import family NSS transporter small subunit [Moraxellaceae bacterium]